MHAVALFRARFARQPRTPLTTALALCTTLGASSASANPNGAPTPSCNGCHAGDQVFDGSITLEPAGDLTPGQSTRFTLRVEEREMSVLGFYLSTGGIGSFAPADGVRVTAGDVTHSRPATFSDGSVEIGFDWSAPSEAGGTDFMLFVLAANGDRTSMGDRYAQAAFSFVWGCDGVQLYRDIDGDGFGQTGYTSLDCAVRDGWADTLGDCVDTRREIFPGAPEIANGKDDDCDGEIDEGIESALLYPDVDGDGHGAMSASPIEGPPGLEGYSANAEDCDDTNAGVHLDAVEVCNGLDDDCNGERDDGPGVYESCGLGACARRIEVCDAECQPGEPSEESCNGLDDDCDGRVDEGELCGEGLACIEFACRAASAAAGLATSPDAVTGAEGTGEPNASSDGEGSAAPGGSVAQGSSDPEASSVPGASGGAQDSAEPVGPGGTDVGSSGTSAMNSGTELEAPTGVTSHGAGAESGCSLVSVGRRSADSWSWLGAFALLLTLRQMARLSLAGAGPERSRRPRRRAALGRTATPGV